MAVNDAAPYLLGLPIAALAIDASERVVAMNPVAICLLGEGLINRHYISVLRQPVILDAVEATIQDRATRNCRFLSKDSGSDTAFNVTCYAILDEYVIVCFEDQTDIEQVFQMRRDFVANVSHELKTPLTAMMGFIETLQTTARDDAQARGRFLNVMASETQRMNRLVGDLLSLSRVEADERMRPTTSLDVKDLIQAALDAIAPLAQDRDARVSFEAPEDPIEIFADKDQLQQVFTNLIDNAIKYSGKGAQVGLELGAPEFDPRLGETAVTITINDNGPGIDPIHLPRLTERFYRIDNHRSRELGGTGLGLAIVKHILNRHRGRLKIDSSLGQGSQFSVILPSAKKRPADQF